MQTANRLAPAARSPENSRIEQLVTAIDQQQIGEGAASWIAQVLGVHTDGRDFWVQIAPADRAAESLVLRISAYATPQQAIAALAVIRPRGGVFPQVINVMQPAQ